MKRKLAAAATLLSCIAAPAVTANASPVAGVRSPQACKAAAPQYLMYGFGCTASGRLRHH